jgi:F1F0 ATPase subunit 2
MNYNLVLSLLFAFIIGVITSLFYFGGLWLTVKKVTQVNKPYLLLIGSFFIRSIVILPIFYFVFKESYLNLIPCLAGFLLIRFFLLNKISQKPESKELNKTEIDI